MMEEKNLFPAIEPREKGFLQVSKIHSIYWERSGNPNGKKIFGATANGTVSTDGAAFTIVFTGNTHGWKITEK